MGSVEGSVAYLRRQDKVVLNLTNDLVRTNLSFTRPPTLSGLLANCRKQSHHSRANQVASLLATHSESHSIFKKEAELSATFRARSRLNYETKQHKKGDEWPVNIYNIYST